MEMRGDEWREDDTGGREGAGQSGRRERRHDRGRKMRMNREDMMGETRGRELHKEERSVSAWRGGKRATDRRGKRRVGR